MRVFFVFCLSPDAFRQQSLKYLPVFVISRALMYSNSSTVFFQYVCKDFRTRGLTKSTAIRFRRYHNITNTKHRTPSRASVLIVFPVEIKTPLSRFELFLHFPRFEVIQHFAYATFSPYRSLLRWIAINIRSNTRVRGGLENSIVYGFTRSSCTFEVRFK